MRTTVDIEPTLLKRIRDEAHRRGIPFKEMLTSVIRRGLEPRREPRRAAQTPVFSMGRVKPGFDLTKALRVAEELHDEDQARSLRSRTRGGKRAG